MADNGKKEFPINGLEEDCTGDWKKYYCYVQNIKGLRKYVKRQMNKRFRKRGKIIRN